MRVTATSPNSVPNSVGAQGHLRHFWSSEQHHACRWLGLTGKVWLNSYQCSKVTSDLPQKITLRCKGEIKLLIFHNIQINLAKIISIHIRHHKLAELQNGWLVGRLTFPFSTKVGHTGDKVLVEPHLGIFQYVTYRDTERQCQRRWGVANGEGYPLPSRQESDSGGALQASPSGFGVQLQPKLIFKKYECQKAIWWHIFYWIWIPSMRHIKHQLKPSTT